MPLYQGKKNFSRNVKTLLNEGRNKDQALAIAYSVLRKKNKKKKRTILNNRD